jgi:hypothetical protein
MVTKEEIEKLKNCGKILDENTSTSTSTIIDELEKMQDGTNVHLISKSVTYLKYFERNKEERFKYGYDILRDLQVASLYYIKYKDRRFLELNVKNWF